MPDKICPFMSNENAKVTCLGAECQIFVEETGQCSINEFLEYLDNINTSLMMR